MDLGLTGKIAMVGGASRGLGFAVAQALVADDKLMGFGLTEPDHGSDIAGGLATTATRDGDEWVIRGAKRWIGAGTIADVALVWARDTADGEIKGFVVPTDTPGYEATKISGKMGLRIMQNADITLDVRLPADAILPGATTFAATRALLRDLAARLHLRLDDSCTGGR